MKTRSDDAGFAIFVFFLSVFFLFAITGVLDAAFAQGNPFGVGPRPAQAPPPADGFLGWIFAKQAEFYRMLSGSVRAVKTDTTAAAGLFGISFLYGVFHAAGPGHGKAVISSYLFANNETWRRGIVLSFASAMLQALVAIALVSVASLILRQTSRQMSNAVWYIEIIAYSLIIVIGVQLLWRKAGGFLAALRGQADGHDHGHDHHRDHDHHHHDHDDHHGHSHGPEPEELAGPGGWRRGLAAIVAVGLRPCSGAILVLIFALAQGIFWAGVGATLLIGLGTAITVAVIASIAVGARDFAGRIARAESGRGALFLRGLEVLAALAVIAFGALLLTGYIVSERMSI